MKKILYIAVLAIVCWSCNKNSEVIEPKQEYQEGQKVTIKVAKHNQEYNAPRRISGTWSDKDGGFVGFVWEWEPDGEQIKVVYNNASAIFTCKQKDANTATFEGIMPGGWEPGKEAKVYAGDIDIEDHEWPISNQGQIKTNGIASNMMRFEGTMTKIDEIVELKAAWSAFRFPIFFHAIDVDESDKKGGVISFPIGTLVNFQTEYIDFSAKCNGSIVNYHYDINEKGGYQILSSAGVSGYPYYLCIVKPGEYSDIKVTIKFDLDVNKTYVVYTDYSTRPSATTYYKLSDQHTQEDTYTFTAKQGGTLEKDFIYTPDDLEKEYYFVKE